MKKDSPSGVLVPGGLLLGMGIGFLTDNLIAGLFIGLGSGLILMTVIELLLQSKRKQ
ncbi:hypothetical protein KC950_02220 [Candidatus Saccharibacteria bacterium]|nr:hypothetical protein [Candidatus Saccharibacteria bacterium]